MKKLFAMFLTAAMALSLVACGGNNSTAALAVPAVILLWWPMERGPTNPSPSCAAIPLAAPLT